MNIPFQAGAFAFFAQNHPAVFPKQPPQATKKAPQKCDAFICTIYYSDFASVRFMPLAPSFI